MTKIVGYIRVSTDKQADKGVSLDAQKDKLQKYADLFDLELVAIIEDRGASGKTLDRDGLQQALQMMKDGKAEGLLVAKLDRLTRSVQGLGFLVENYFNKFSLCSVAEQVDTRTAAGRLVLNVLTSVAQWERETIGERTSTALQHKRANLEYTGGKVRYGFKLAKDGKNLEADPVEQQVIKFAVENSLKGMSLRKIGAALIEQGLKPRKGQKWGVSTLRTIINSNKEDQAKKSA